MNFLQNRLGPPVCLGMVLLSFAVLPSCNPQPGTPGGPKPPTGTPSPGKPDPREDLVKLLKGASVDGYFFATKEDADQSVATLTNPTLREPVKLDSTNRLVLQYANVKDKKANTTKTLKAEIVRGEGGYKLFVTDVVADRVIAEEAFAPRLCPGVPVFDTLDQCFEDFNCKVLPELQCEANKTCKNIRTELRCCMRDGTEIHALILIVPTSRRCIVAFPFDIDQVLVRP
jgi:hypothetical protein